MPQRLPESGNADSEGIHRSPLEDVYIDLDFKEKLAIVDQFVDLLVELESIKFSSAGTFAVSSSLPLKSSDFVTEAQEFPPPTVLCFNKGDEEFVKTFTSNYNRRGQDLKAFLSSHIDSWIHKGLRVNPYDDVFVPSFRRMLPMLESLDQEGAFADAPYPIVLHHTDLEPRNIMVSNAGPGTKWKICGIIDWDEAVAVPCPLARRPPAWIWGFDPKSFKAYLNIDHHPYFDEDLREEGKALRKYFDTVARKRLGEKYLEDAYGHGRWLRRIWEFVRGGVPNEDYLELIKKMEEEWEARERTKPMPSTTSSTSTTFTERAVQCLLNCEVSMRKRL